MLRTISMTGTVNVSIMTVVSFVLNMSRVDSDTTGLLFGCLVDLRVVGELGGSLLSKDLGNGCCQRSLAMVDVTCLYSCTVR